MDLGGVSAADEALDALNVGLDHLMKLVEDGGLEVFDDAQLVDFLQGFERLRNRLPLVDHAVIGAAVGRDLPAKLTQASPQRMLAAMLRISVGEAARRVHAAEGLAERTTMTGEPLSPIRPHLAAAQRAGDIGQRHHVTAWADGGATDLDNLTLLCAITTTTSSARAGNAGSTLTGCPNGGHPGGSTEPANR
jgi:hypothetical protein